MAVSEMDWTLRLLLFHFSNHTLKRGNKKVLNSVCRIYKMCVRCFNRIIRDNISALMHSIISLFSSFEQSAIDIPISLDFCFNIALHQVVNSVFVFFFFISPFILASCHQKGIQSIL